MKAVPIIPICVEALACLVALAVSIYPGVLFDWLFVWIIFFFVGPIVGITLFVWLIVLVRGHKLRIGRYSVSGVAVVVAILVATLTLLTFYVPRRIAFAISRASFEPLVQNAPVSWDRVNPLNRRLGPYKVDAYAADARGGVYFRVYTGPDGPDRMSYGFVYKPNPEGTPFGAASYEVHPLSRDWCWFCASDDWY
jgi:hypothetical protein